VEPADLPGLSGSDQARESLRFVLRSSSFVAIGNTYVECHSRCVIASTVNSCYSVENRTRMYQPRQGVCWHRESFNDQFDCQLPAEARIELLGRFSPHDLSHQRRTSRLSTSASAAGDQSAGDSAAGRSLQLESASPQSGIPKRWHRNMVLAGVPYSLRPAARCDLNPAYVFQPTGGRVSP
jgi:hypothetical protein